FLAEARPRLATIISLAEDHCAGPTCEPFLAKLKVLHLSFSLADGLREDHAESLVLRADVRGRFPGKKHWTNHDAREQAAELHVQFRADHEEAVAALGTDLAAHLADALAGFVAFFDQAKEAEELLDFDDLLIRTRDMLRDRPEARSQLKRAYRVLLVDEFQDTDPLQVEIVFFLAESAAAHADRWEDVTLDAGKLFLVGDPKQSIYRFRRADIEVYEQAKSVVARQGEVLHLSQSFRMVPHLAEAVNAVFAPVMQRPEDGAYQPDYVPLVPYRETPGDAAFLAPPPPGIAEDMENVDDWHRAEAGYAAALCRRLVEAGHVVEDPDTREPRAVEYGDIAVLARRFASANAYADAFAEAGVPFQIVGGKHFYTADEVHGLVAVLQAVDDPHDRVARVAALRGPFFGVSDDELVIAEAHGGFDTIAEPAAVLRELHELRNAAAPSRLIERLFERTKALELFLLRPRGAQRVANLLKIVERAREMEAAERVSFRGFVRWLSQVRETDAGEGEAPLAGKADCVRFLSIHASKGLEFPVVLVADLASSPLSGDHFVVHRERGDFAFYLKSKDGPFRTANWPGDAYEEQRQEAEQARLLYVAATRARDRLFLMTHWAGKARGKPFQRFLNAAFADPAAPWGERLPCGVVLEPPTFDAEGAASRARRIEVPEGPPSAQARERLAARTAWQGELNALLATADGGTRWCTPSRLGHGFVAADATASGEEAGSDDGRRIGTAVHQALERACLATADELDAAARSAAREQGLSDGAAETVRRLVATAAGSDLLRRAREAGGQHEVPFAVAVEDVILSGSIDLLFVEDGELTLVDFKTDAGQDLAALADAYRPQMLAYALAARRTLCTPVREVILFFLAAGREWPIAVTDDALAEVADEIVGGSTGCTESGASIRDGQNL
ncbi:UvrD-helicase domain-containing protein, partial [bacterium]|nr:UvrD-helicase domain-containing protein [bacterium]